MKISLKNIEPGSIAAISSVAPHTFVCSVKEQAAKIIYVLLFLLTISITSCKTKKPEQHVHASEQEHVYYTCSMHTQVMQSKPGKMSYLWYAVDRS